MRTMPRAGSRQATSASIDPNGYLQITDRAKDVIKSGGEWVSSVDLENCACGHPDVLMGRRDRSCVIRNGKSDRCCSSCRDRAAHRHAIPCLRISQQHFAKWQLPDDVLLVDAIPLTATGKLNKLALRERYRDHLMQQPAG
jgi:fatty-acyl-CoA synthase